MGMRQVGRALPYHGVGVFERNCLSCDSSASMRRSRSASAVATRRPRNAAGCLGTIGVPGRNLKTITWAACAL
jgi:hypothetical protein